MKKLKFKNKYKVVIENESLNNKEKLNYILIDTIVYFNSENRCGKGKGCSYHPTDVGEGCAVGRLFIPSSAILMDKCGGTIDEVIYSEEEYGILVPQFIKDNLLFFETLQNLHDLSYYWNNEGLSDKGRDKVETIKRIHDLN